MSIDTSELYYLAAPRGKAFVIALTEELFEAMLPGGDGAGMPDQERIVLGMKALVEQGIIEVTAHWAEEPWLQAEDPAGSGDLLQLVAKDSEEDIVMLCPLLGLSNRNIEICIPATFLDLEDAPSDIETIFTAKGTEWTTSKKLAEGYTSLTWQPIELPEDNCVPARKAATAWGFMG